MTKPRRKRISVDAIRRELDRRTKQVAEKRKKKKKKGMGC